MNPEEQQDGAEVETPPTETTEPGEVTTEEPGTEETTDTEPTTETETTEPGAVEEPFPGDTGNLEITETTPPEVTEFVTDHGMIQVIHEITLGDLLTVSFLFGILLLLLLGMVIRRR